MSSRRLLSRIGAWLKAVWRWLLAARLFWLTSLVVFGSLVIALGRGTTEPRIRLTGLALELLGTSTVALGIRQTREFYGKPGLFAIATEWLRRVPRLTGRVVTGSIVLTAGPVTLTASGHAARLTVSRPNLEDRVAALEAELRELDVRQDETRHFVEKEIRDRQSALEAERQARMKEEEDIRTKLELSDTGGLNLSVTGLVWLAVGLCLSTASVEIARALGPL
jgi:hypothetical protein